MAKRKIKDFPLEDRPRERLLLDQKRLDFYLETIPDRKVCRQITRKVWSAVAARVKEEQAR